MWGEGRGRNIDNPHSFVGSGLLGGTCWGGCAEEARGMDGEGEGACAGLLWGWVRACDQMGGVRCCAAVARNV